MPPTADDAPAELVGIGAATLDVLTLAEGAPPGDAVIEAREITTSGGGPVATALCTASSLGRSTLLVDALGDDWAGRWIVDDLERFGVDTRTISVVPGTRSATATILVRPQDGQRTIYYRPSTAPEPDFNSTVRDRVRRARILHVNGRHESTAMAACQLARDSGVSSHLMVVQAAIESHSFPWSN